MFLYEIRKILQKFKIPSDTAIFVATNEEDKEALSLLESNKFYTFRSLHGTKEYDAFERFLIELQTMCEAKYLIHFG